jgi:preprotein translocase subunit SecE
MSIIDVSIKFLRESRAEIKKINWLARPQLVNYTVLVIVFMVATAAFLGSLDWGFAYLLQKFVIKTE